MLKLDIPGFGNLAIAHLVLDYNGTLAVDGHVLEGVREELDILAGLIDIHVVAGQHPRRCSSAPGRLED